MGADSVPTRPRNVQHPGVGTYVPLTPLTPSSAPARWGRLSLEQALLVVEYAEQDDPRADGEA